MRVNNKVSPRVQRDDMPPADGSSMQKSRRIYVRPRTGPQSAHLWWPAVAELQAACSVPITQAGATWDRQTDGRTYGSRYRLIPPPGAVGHNRRSSLKPILDSCRWCRRNIIAIEIAYSLRTRNHSKFLILKTSDLGDRHFIIGSFNKNLY